VVKLTKDQIVERLTADGFAFARLEVVEESECSVEDAFWNYRDLGHYNVVHAARDGSRIHYNPVSGDDLSYILVKRPLGLPWPIAATTYALDDRTLTTFSTIFCFVLIGETRFQETGRGCRVVSVYEIGSPKILRWALPIIRRLLERDHHSLMREDLPMRERRGKLRSWGFGFRSDGALSGEATLDLSASHVEPPIGGGENAACVALDEVLPRDGEALVGRDDHLGLRLVRRGRHLLVYPRLCPHEGASLDPAPCRGRTIHCPWHGRAFAPLAEFALDSPEERQAETSWSRITLRGRTLEIRAKRPVDA